MKYFRIAPRIAKFFEADNTWNEDSGDFWTKDPNISEAEKIATIKEVLEKAQKDLQPLVDN